MEEAYPWEAQPLDRAHLLEQAYPLEEAHPLGEAHLRQVSQDFLVAVELGCLELLVATAFISLAHLGRPMAHSAAPVDQGCQDLALEAHCLV